MRGPLNREPLKIPMKLRHRHLHAYGLIDTFDSARGAGAGAHHRAIVNMSMWKSIENNKCCFV